jgi:hypothetical protein
MNYIFLFQTEVLANMTRGWLSFALAFEWRTGKVVDIAMKHRYKNLSPD